MTDQIERFLRDEFEGDASRAPDLGAVSGGRLAASVRDGVRRTRRRRLALGAAGACVVLIAAPFGVLAARDSDPAVTAPPAQAAGVPAPNGQDDGLLMLHGVALRVPSAMLDPDRERACHASEDVAWTSAWYRRPGGVTTACTSDLTVADLRRTDIELSAISPTVDVDRLSGERRVAGRTEVRRWFPDRDVLLTVTSPDPERARRYAEAAEQVAPEGQVDGCQVEDPGDLIIDSGEQPSPLTRSDPLAPERPVSGFICGYAHGWLVGSRILGTADLERVALHLNAEQDPVNPALRDCIEVDPVDGSNGAWQLRLVDEGGVATTVRVTPLRCQTAPIVNDQGVEKTLSPETAVALDELATGPLQWWDGGTKTGR